MRGYRFFWGVIGPPPPYGCLQFFLLVDLPRTLQQFGSAPEIPVRNPPFCMYDPPPPSVSWIRACVWANMHAVTCTWTRTRFSCDAPPTGDLISKFFPWMMCVNFFRYVRSSQRVTLPRMSQVRRHGKRRNHLSFEMYCLLSVSIIWYINSFITNISSNYVA